MDDDVRNPGPAVAEPQEQPGDAPQQLGEPADCCAAGTGHWGSAVPEEDPVDGQYEPACEPSEPILGASLRASRAERQRAAECSAELGRRGTGSVASRAAALAKRLVSPARMLGASLVLAVAMTLCPAMWTSMMKAKAADLLHPGQAIVLRLREQGSRLAGRAQVYFATAAELAEARRERERLADENRRLAAQLAAARNEAGARREAAEGPEPLLGARCVRARVLGELAQAYLERRHVLDVGTEAGIEPGTLVLRAPAALIDQGRDAGLESGQLVLAAGSVWGKIVQVGRCTSVVRTLTEPGYRDLVRLGPSGPEAILEGTGEPLARLRMVEVTEPVAVGDAVYSTAAQGAVPQPLLCGRVVRVERPAGAAHWDIWMQPTAKGRGADEVAVLRVEMNAGRVVSDEW